MKYASETQGTFMISPITSVEDVLRPVHLA